MARKEPQNIDAEISVLGCGFLEKSALDKIMDEVSDEMFYSEANKTIYKAMKALHSNNIPVDANTLCNELDKNKSLSAVGGVEYITDIINSVPSTANLNYYIKIIFEKSILRKIKRVELINSRLDNLNFLTFLPNLEELIITNLDYQKVADYLDYSDSAFNIIYDYSAISRLKSLKKLVIDNDVCVRELDLGNLTLENILIKEVLNTKIKPKTTNVTTTIITPSPNAQSNT